MKKDTFFWHVGDPDAISETYHPESSEVFLFVAHHTVAGGDQRYMLAINRDGVLGILFTEVDNVLRKTRCKIQD